MTGCKPPMVQQVIDKFNQYTSFHCENTKLSTSESIMSTSAENSRNSKEKIATNDTIMASVGAKRQHPDSSLSSSSHQSHVNRGVNGHLVYVRRKLSQNVDSSSSLLSMKLDNELKHELKVQQDKAQECNNEIVDTRGPSNLDCKAPDDPKRQSNQDPSPPIVPLDTQELVNDANAPVNHQIAPIDPQRARYQNSKSPADLQSNQHSEKTIDPQRVSNQYCNARVCPQGPSNQHSKTPPVDPQRSRTQDWKQRYIQLQAFLKNCEQSSLEDYKQSKFCFGLTAVDHSRCALELEKRALNLLLEEGKELHRMQVLNIVGKAKLQDHSSESSPATQIFAAQSQFQRMESMHSHKSPFLSNVF